MADYSAPEDGITLRLLVGIRFQVLFTPLAGVLFTFPSRYWFTIGRQRVFSLARWSSQIPAGFLVSRGTQEPASSRLRFRLRGCHTLWPAFPGHSASGPIGDSTTRPARGAGRLCRPAPCAGLACGPYNPRGPRRTHGFGLFRFRSPLLSESRLLSLPPGTEMVHFPGFAPPTYGFSRRYPGFTGIGFPIRKSPDQSLLAAPRGLSQLATSFFACWRQGIHRTPLVA